MAGTLELTRSHISGAIKLVNALGLKDDLRKEAMRKMLAAEFGDRKDEQGQTALVDKVMSDLESYPEWRQG